MKAEGSLQHVDDLEDVDEKVESGSVGSATFWRPGSGSTKIYGYMDPDPRVRSKYQQKTKPELELLKKDRLTKISLSLKRLSSLSSKISEKRSKITLKFFFCSKTQ